MFGKPSRHLRKHLDEHGKKATAVVVEIAAKGMAITNGAEGVIGNTTLALKTKLRVEPYGEPSFEIEKRFRYGQLSVPSAGMKVGVVYDPADHDKIMLDETAAITYDPMVRARAAQGQSGAPVLPAELNTLLAGIRDAQADSHGDKDELRKLLQERFAGQNVTVAEGADLTIGASKADIDPLDRLEKLSKLHREGALTDEEFAKAKAEILADGV